MQWNLFVFLCVYDSVFYPYKGSTSSSESESLSELSWSNTFLSAHAVLTEKAEAFQQCLNLPRCIAGELLIHTEQGSCWVLIRVTQPWSSKLSLIFSVEYVAILLFSGCGYRVHSYQHTHWMGFCIIAELMQAYYQQQLVILRDSHIRFSVGKWFFNICPTSPQTVGVFILALQQAHIQNQQKKKKEQKRDQVLFLKVADFPFNLCPLLVLTWRLFSLCQILTQLQKSLTSLFLSIFFNHSFFFVSYKIQMKSCGCFGNSWDQVSRLNLVERHFFFLQQ